MEEEEEEVEEKEGGRGRLGRRGKGKEKGRGGERGRAVMNVSYSVEGEYGRVEGGRGEGLSPIYKPLNRKSIL